MCLRTGACVGESAGLRGSMELSCREKGPWTNRKRQLACFLERAEWDPSIPRTDSLTLLVFNTRKRARRDQHFPGLPPLPGQCLPELRAKCLACGRAVSGDLQSPEASHKGAWWGDS